MTSDESRDTGARYYARGGKVYAQRPGQPEEEAGTALSAYGRELERHEVALNIARVQRREDART